MSTINLKLHFFKLFLITKIINKIKWFGIKGSWVECGYYVDANDNIYT